MTTAAIPVRATDVSEQKEAWAEVPPDTSVGELLEELISSMDIPPLDSAGRPLLYSAYRERDQQSLHASDRAGDVLEENDLLYIQPNIDAGRHLDTGNGR